MRVSAVLGWALLACAVAFGTFADPGDTRRGRPSGVLEADLHVHPHPGDGTLSIRELEREAARRGLDVIAVTAHNSRMALNLPRLLPRIESDVIVLPGQEITAPLFHLVAVGTSRLIDWRLPLRDAIEAVHAQGGIAIAAHPVESSWRDPDTDALRLLDGTEVAHPGRRRVPPWRDEYLRFYRRVLAVNPDVAAIGSTDFHTAAPLGYCRTYVLTSDRSAYGVLEAIRQGRTVARRPDGRLHGAEAHVAAVQRYLAAGVPSPAVTAAERAAAWGALAGLALICLPGRLAGGGRIRP